jgi:threonylcarbamoyladenosine tRNA methylthiotransferase MtaB
MENRYVVRTLGCKANLADSQCLEAELQRRGWNPGVPADLCIVNSCTVTDEADRQSRKLASRLARENPNAAIVVTGCSAEVDPERLARSKGIDYVVGNRDKPRLVELVLGKVAERASAPARAIECEPAELLGVVEGYDELRSRHPMDRDWPLPEEALERIGSGDSRRTRGFLKIQEGCNAFCTYCVIPYGRGPSRSLTPDEVVARAGRLVGQGPRELVITGTNIGDYGTDLGEDPVKALVALLSRLFAETPVERLRVGSLDPLEITPGLIALMEREPRFCPHFHVSLQSPHARVLRMMKRRYGFDEVRRCLEEIAARLPSAYVGMDVITGFPGESAEEFEWGVERLRELPWTRLHVFPFSEREGTPATRLPGVVPPAERRERARRLAELSLARLRERVAAVAARGRMDGILLESPVRARDGGVEWVAGHSREYFRALVRAGAHEVAGLRNRVVSVAIDGIDVDAPAGEVSLVGSIA